MYSPAFALGLNVVSDNIARPLPARKNAKAPSNDELDSMELPDYGLTSKPGPSTAPTSPQSANEDQTPALDEVSFPKTPNELECSRPPSPRGHEATDIVPTLWFPKMNKWRVLSACMEYLGNGLNDSAPGALIPYIETWYSIGYAVVSTIWISNAVGFIAAAFLSDVICTRLGRAKTLMLSEISIIVGYAVIACPVPFPAVVVAYSAVGFGEAVSIALNNVFCANMANSTVILGAAHGSYGIGGIIGPIMATALVSNGIHWSRFYAIAIGLRLLNMAAVGWSFWNYEKEGTAQFSNSLEQIASQQTAAEGREVTKFKIIAQGLRNRTTLVGALFIFAYQGAEVSESGWFITYLISRRNAVPAHVGYVTSGFWAGITIGRFVLTYPARSREKTFMFAMLIGIVVFQLLAWFVPSVIGDSVAVALLGLLLGPVYPAAQTVFTRLLPARTQVFAIGFISSMGSSGGAVVPFLTGLLSQAVGTFVLHPICIAFYMLMVVLLFALPRVEKRTT